MSAERSLHIVLKQVVRDMAALRELEKEAERLLAVIKAKAGK